MSDLFQIAQRCWHCLHFYYLPVVKPHLFWIDWLIVDSCSYRLGNTVGWSSEASVSKCSEEAKESYSLKLKSYLLTKDCAKM